MTNLSLSDLPGFYVLTTGVELGYFEQNQLVVDSTLSIDLRDHLETVARLCREEIEANELRVACVFRANPPRRWGEITLSFSDDSVHKLFPTREAKANELTAFQQRNRECSLYRGIEMLLAYRHPIAKDVPYYAPVLIDRRITFADLPGEFGLPSLPDAQSHTALEVINLLAPIHLAERGQERFTRLVAALARLSVDASARKSTVFSMVGEPSVNSTPQRSPAPEKVSSLTEATVAPPAPTRPKHPVAHFTRFATLGPEGVMQLLKLCPIREVPAGTMIFRHGERDEWNVYLFAGTVELEAADGKRTTVEAGTPKAESPLANLKPRMFTARALTAVQLLCTTAAIETVVLKNSPPALP